MSGGEEKTFLYFAYGSNMLTQRIRINNPSARFLQDKMIKIINEEYEKPL